MLIDKDKNQTGITCVVQRHKSDKDNARAISNSNYIDTTSYVSAANEQHFGIINRAAVALFNRRSKSQLGSLESAAKIQVKLPVSDRQESTRVRGALFASATITSTFTTKYLSQ